MGDAAELAMEMEMDDRAAHEMGECGWDCVYCDPPSRKPRKPKRAAVARTTDRREDRNDG